MSMLMVFIGGVLGTGAVAWLLVRIWMWISLRAGILDVPTHRSSHVRVTPRGGGVGIVAASLGALAVAAAMGHVDVTDLVWLGGLALSIAAVSFWDDLRSLPSLARLACHVAAATAAMCVFGSFSVITVPMAGTWHLSPWIASVLTIIWIVGITNVFNFMDGIDGIAGGQGIVAGMAWAVFGFVERDPLVHWFGLALAAACGGFLFLNWSPARIFMGDVGSAFLGFCFGVLPLLALRGHGSDQAAGSRMSGVVPIFAVLVIWPFVADGVVTFVRRALRGENVLLAHRSHLYQRLTIAGWCHASVSRLYIAWATGSAAGAAVYCVAQPVGRILVMVTAVMSAVAIYTFVVSIERRQGPPKGGGLRGAADPASYLARGR